jgi:dipeptidyl aminopeptidase/acylaminoacyl peptidase
MQYFKLLIITAGLWAPYAHSQTDNAVKFGTRDDIQNISISPDGSQIAYVQSGIGKTSLLNILKISGGTASTITQSDGEPWNLRSCSWASNSRLVCQVSGLIRENGGLTPYGRVIAINSDGKEVKLLSQRSSRSLGVSQFDGDVVGWPISDDGSILMSRQYRPDFQTGTIVGSKAEGLGVDRLDTLTLKSSRVEAPRKNADYYLADTAGVVRIMATSETDGSGYFKGISRYYYRSPEDKEWKIFSTISSESTGMQPVAVDHATNTAFSIGKNNGRNAIYSVKLDQTLLSSILISDEKVDVDGIVTLGRTGRVIGATYVADKTETVIFDTDYKRLSEKLGKALPGLPLVRFVDASRDEGKLILFAGSDVDPGRYYLYDKATRQLAQIAPARPLLDARPLSPVKAMQYAAADGTMIPAYLTLPIGQEPKNLPTIVMPHGGPASRDEWGFDWLSQYFASEGFAVIQPNFRGSAGYGDDWYVKNGFKSWQTAIGDVNDAGKWAIQQGLADPKRIAVVGWSYGGYAALQSGVLDADLFHAAIAIAPVTDLRLLVDQWRDFENAKVVAQYVGAGEHVIAGSPLQQVNKLKAPVLMFSGDMDLNVSVGHAKAMDEALKKQGKSSELVIYSGLDHQIDDSSVRADMLRKSLEFLKKHLSI